MLLIIGVEDVEGIAIRNLDDFPGDCTGRPMDSNVEGSIQCASSTTMSTDRWADIV